MVTPEMLDASEMSPVIAWLPTWRALLGQGAGIWNWGRAWLCPRVGKAQLGVQGDMVARVCM